MRIAIGVAMVLLVLLPSVAAPDEKGPPPPGPSRQEMDGARHRLEKFERKVELARGQPMKLDHDAMEALDRIKKLKEAWPDHPEVEDLFQRARKALETSEGKVVQIEPEVLAYRTNALKLRDRFAETARARWEKFLDEIRASGNLLEKAMPAPRQEEAKPAEVIGKFVMLEDFEYPTNEFSDLGRQFCFVGSGTAGYYFVDLAGRPWIGAYEAVRRYKRLVCSDVPEGMKWTVVGRITGIDLLVPQAGKEKKRAAAWGWIVEPMAIWVPDRTFSQVNLSLETGGSFAGEEEMEDIKREMYTVTEVPPDVTPERLVEIFATAIKEKNLPLYFACISPRRHERPKGRSLCMYHWDWHQYRFATFYCKVIVGKAEVKVIKGYDSEDPLKSFFLDPEHLARMKQVYGPKIEQAFVETRSYDERGLQYGSPKPFELRRVEGERWYIESYAQPF